MEYKVGRHYLYKDDYCKYIVEMLKGDNYHSIRFKVLFVIEDYHPYAPTSPGTIINTKIGWSEMPFEELSEEGILYGV